MKILLIFSGLGHNKGGLCIFMTSMQKHSITGASCCINRKKMANNGEEQKTILIFKPSHFIIKGSTILPDCAKWKNIYI